MNFSTGDYILGTVTLVAAILGMFGGFLGALGFCAGVVAAGLSVKFGFPLAKEFVATSWAAALATLVLALLAFGLTRVLVKRIVKGLLAQPADAIFGFLVAGVTGAGMTGAAIVVADQMLGAHVDSAVVRLVMGYFG